MIVEVECASANSYACKDRPPLEHHHEVLRWDPGRVRWTMDLLSLEDLEALARLYGPVILTSRNKTGDIPRLMIYDDWIE